MAYLGVHHGLTKLDLSGCLRLSDAGLASICRARPALAGRVCALLWRTGHVCAAAWCLLASPARCSLACLACCHLRTVAQRL